MRFPLARERRRPAGFILPCQPRSRTLCRAALCGCTKSNSDRVRLWSRNGRDWSRQFTAVAQAIAALPTRELVIDGEACAHCPEGLPDFHSLRGEEGGANACLFAFDLLWHDGRDLRRLPLEERRARLRAQLRARPAVPPHCRISGRGRLKGVRARLPARSGGGCLEAARSGISVGPLRFLAED
jgi:hypothetical protein